MATPQGKDPIDATKAIYNEQQLINEGHRQKLLTLATSERHVILSYPADMTDNELLDFIGYLTHEFKAQLPPLVIQHSFGRRDT